MDKPLFRIDFQDPLGKLPFDVRREGPVKERQEEVFVRKRFAKPFSFHGHFFLRDPQEVIEKGGDILVLPLAFEEPLQSPMKFFVASDSHAPIIKGGGREVSTFSETEEMRRGISIVFFLAKDKACRIIESRKEILLMNKKKLVLLLTPFLLISCGEDKQKLIPEGEEVPVATAKAAYATACEAMKNQKAISVNVRNGHLSSKSNLSIDYVPSGSEDPIVATSLSTVFELSISNLNLSLALPTDEEGTSKGHLKASADYVYKLSAEAQGSSSSLDYSGSLNFAAYLDEDALYVDSTGLSSLPGLSSEAGTKFKLTFEKGTNILDSVDFSSMFEALKKNFGEKGEEKAILGKNGDYSLVYQADPVSFAKNSFVGSSDDLQISVDSFVCGDGAFLDLVLTFGEKGITRLGYESSLNAKASVSASASASSVLLSAEVSNSAYLVADFAYDESVEVESVPNPSEFQEQKDLLG